MQFTEATNTVNQLANSWEEFKVTNDRRLKDIENKGRFSIADDEYINRMNNSIDECTVRINKIENSEFRPVLSQTSVEKQNFFRNYIRKGVTQSLLGKKSLTEDSGIPLTQTIYDEIISSLNTNSTMRQLASVDTISSDYITFFKPDADIAASWGDAISQQQQLPSVTKYNIHTHMLYSCPTITRKLLEDSAIDIDSWITNNLSEAFNLAENKAFFHGDGANKPLGVLQGIDQSVNTEAAGIISETDIMNLYYSLGEEYANNASFVMHRSTAHLIRSIKSQTGQYIWQPGLQSTPDTLMGAPVYHCSEMSEVGPGNIVIAFGDFKRGYKIIDRAEINILRDQFSHKPNVAFYATKRVGGASVDRNAIQFLSVKGS